MRARCGMALMCAVVMAASALAQPQRPQQPQQSQQTQQPQQRTPSAAQPRTPAAPRASADQTPPPPPPPPVAGPGTRRQGQPVNIKVEFTLTDQRGTAPPITRTISLVVAD